MTDKMWDSTRDEDTGIHGKPIEREPYMATVRASRVSGNAVLFDSEHRHQNFITLTISSATRERGLSTDWIFGGEGIVQVAMTESQWATMISSLNFGSGTPATLQRLQGESIEQPELPEDKTEHFSAEMVDAINAVIKRLNDLKGGKHTKATKNELEVAIGHLQANIPYVSRSFDEHMEKRVDKAKAEIEAHMNAAVQRAGLEALLARQSGPKMIEHDDE